MLLVISRSVFYLNTILIVVQHFTGVQSFPIADNKKMTKAQWCPEQQIYIGGNPASSGADEHISHVLENELPLHIFGYGSLCWHPGGGVLSHPSVQKQLGVTKGYRRCWSQKSTDHRGEVHFPGLVCTLLSDEEYKDIVEEHGGDVNSAQNEESITNGMVYVIPKELVKECLDELDFREKGGYARDVIDVVLAGGDNDDAEGKEEKPGNKVTMIKAMLYRGTPDNPGFSIRALTDEIHAASIMSRARGPSGENSVYLNQLNEFLSNCVADSNGDLVGDSQTTRLAALTQLLQDHHLYFLYGSGSNQHDQLLLRSSTKYMNAAQLVNGDEAHDLKEIVLVVPKGNEYNEDGTDHLPKQLFAGGGHSALLTNNGDFYSWGWNENNQLGREHHEGLSKEMGALPHPVVPPLGVKVETAALGHSHTLIIEKSTKVLYAFGDNNRGQVDGCKNRKSKNLTRLDGLGKFVDVSAGLFHSAGITEHGELVTFGCGKFGQSLKGTENCEIGSWKPPDDSRLIKVSCGRRHTICLDEFGRVWSMGDNKYGQLGRNIENERDPSMALVEGILGERGCGCIGIDCGWSHSIAILKADDGRTDYSLYGWGRNDKSQLAFDGEKDPSIKCPRLLRQDLKEACCGSESITIIDSQNRVMSCGWNEHGNLGVGHSEDVGGFTKTKGAILCPQKDDRNRKQDVILMASGGAHLLAARVM